MAEKQKQENKKNESKIDKQNKRAAANNHDEDEEEVLVTEFPPIFNFENEGDFIKFIPLGIEKGPNGNLLRATYIDHNGGVFKKRDEEVSVEESEEFSIGVASAMIGQQKIAASETGLAFGELGQYCAENDVPIKIVFNGIERSKKNKAFRYKLLEIRLPKGTLEKMKF